MSICARDIFFSWRETSTLKISDERCRGETRFPERDEMLVHLNSSLTPPLSCINKMRIPNFPLGRRFHQFWRTAG